MGEIGSVVHLQTEGIGVDFSVEGGIIVDDGICQYTFGQGTVQNASALGASFLMHEVQRIIPVAAQASKSFSFMNL